MMGGEGGLGALNTYAYESFRPDVADQQHRIGTLDQPRQLLLNDLILQAIWRSEAVRYLQYTDGRGAMAKQAEQVLKEVLRENYDSQIKRQELHIDRLQERIAKLRNELERRRSAADRIVELELAKIVLSAQGLIETDRTKD